MPWGNAMQPPPTLPLSVLCVSAPLLVPILLSHSSHRSLGSHPPGSPPVGCSRRSAVLPAGLTATSCTDSSQPFSNLSCRWLLSQPCRSRLLSQPLSQPSAALAPPAALTALGCSHSSALVLSCTVPYRVCALAAACPHGSAAYTALLPTQLCCSHSSAAFTAPLRTPPCCSHSSGALQAPLRSWLPCISPGWRGEGAAR